MSGESRSALEGAAVPSLITLLLCIASTTTAYGTALGLPAETYFGLGAGFTALSFSVLIITRRARRDGSPGGRGFARALLLCLALPACIGAVPGMRAHMAATAAHGGTGAEPVTASVVDTRLLRYSLEAELEAPAGDHTGRLRILAYLPVDADAAPGDTIRFRKKPRALSAGASPNHYARGLLRKGFSHTVSLSADDYTVTSRAAPSTRRDFRSRVSERIDRVFAADTASLLKGLYFGNKNHIKKETVFRFTRAGVLHILAASGSHLATLAFLPLALLGIVRLDRRAIFVLVVLVLAAYLYLTDLPVSLQRAFIMFAIGGLHLLLDHERNTLNALFHSAAAIIILEPWEIYSLGFQLTFGATLGILLFYRNYSGALRALPALLRGPLALTLSAQSLVFPVLALQLGEINIISLASNLVIVPLVQCVFAASAGLLALDAAVPGLAQAPAALVDLCFIAGDRAAAFFSSFPGHFSPGIAMPVLALPYLLYLAPLARLGRFRLPVYLCVPAACLLTWQFLKAPLMDAETVAVLETPATRAAFVIAGGEAHLAGTVGSMEDARLLARAVASSGALTASLRLSSLNYRNIHAAAHLAKSLCISSFTVDRDFVYGKYLGRLLTVLDRDGTTFGAGGSPVNVRKEGDDRLRGNDAFARERAAMLLKEVLDGDRRGTAVGTVPPRRIVRIVTNRGPGGA
jgi:ComEC/Rec2-related protein